jgi:hypothetical protein
MEDLRNRVDVGYRRKLAKGGRDRSTDRVRDVAGFIADMKVRARCSFELLVREHVLIVCVAWRRRAGDGGHRRVSSNRPNEGGCWSGKSGGGGLGRFVT